MNIINLKLKRNNLNKEACSMKISQNTMLHLVQRKLILDAKIAYCEGKYTSLYEARKTVPSIKQLKEYMEGTNATECMQNHVLWATSEEIQEYLA